MNLGRGALCLLPLLTGCSIAIEDVVKDWRAHPFNEVRYAWGQPANVGRDEKLCPGKNRIAARWPLSRKYRSSSRFATGPLVSR